MTAVNEFFSAIGAPLGWTLVNSLWQSLCILLVVIILLRVIPSRLSRLRYGIACGGMLLILMGNVVTFSYLIQELPAVDADQLALQVASATKEKLFVPDQGAVSTLLERLLIGIESNMSLILLCWVAGATFFCLRMMSSWWYIGKLKTEALILNNHWSETLQLMAGKLNIDRIVALGQTERIQTPLVIGYFKPIVLVPVGMLTGLSPEQIETIFIHELAHIRRHDYLVNLIQSFIEAFFFFNPFMWMLSGIIRREREYCCDDTVISKHGSSLAYAHALTNLESLRLSRMEFGLALAENKNHLLNRIKRIMEKSAKNYSGKDKLAPAMLLVVGLTCASWLTIQTDQKNLPDAEHQGTPADTTKRKFARDGKSSKTTIIRIDEDGNVDEQIIENSEGDDMNWRVPFASIDISTPMIADVPFDIPIAPFAPAHPGAIDMIPFPLFRFNHDTIPGRFGFSNGANWEKFSQEFETKFKTQFGDFYQKNEKDFDKMMMELEQNFKERFSEREWELMDQAWAGTDIARMQEELADLSHLDMEQAELEALDAQTHLGIELQAFEETHSEMLEEMERDLQAKGMHLMQMEKDMQGMNARMSRFETELKKQLNEDGYLAKDETIKRMQWNDDGDIEINGKRIKDSDRKKYNEIHRKYFKSSGNFTFIE
jgi:bla regulator protein blaR1